MLMAAICRGTIIKKGTPFISERPLRSLRNDYAVYGGIGTPLISEWLRRSAGICRIGAMVTQLLLKWNGYQFQLEQNELADMFIGIADGTKDETELRYWINDHIE